MDLPGLAGEGKLAVKAESVFGHLALRFAVHPENLATEALSYILRRSPAASRAFTAFICNIGLHDLVSLRFDSQQGGLEGAIPDMKCTDEQGRLRVVVENKFWAGLTENQPVTYIRELPAGVSALVLFVVPESRLLFVWNEVVARCRDAGISTNEIEGPGTAKVANIGRDHCLAATSWKVLLDVLSMAAASAGDMAARDSSPSTLTAHLPPTTEIILEVGAEGGNISVLGRRDALEVWSFWTKKDECTMSDLLSGDDLVAGDNLIETTEPVSSLSDAFGLLGDCRWFGLVPLRIHPEFRPAIRTHVEASGTPEELTEWDWLSVSV